MASPSRARFPKAKKPGESRIPGKAFFKGIHIVKDKFGKWQTDIRFGERAGETLSFPTLKAAKAFIVRNPQDLRRFRRQSKNPFA